MTGTGRGHDRAPSLFLLWRLDPDTREWVELGRVLATDWTWEGYLRPIAVEALDRRQPERIPPDLEAVCNRINVAIAAELKPLLVEEQAQVLATLEHDLAAWYVSIDRR